MSADATTNGTESGANGQPPTQPDGATTPGTPVTYDEAAVASKVSAAINDARKAWKSESDAIIADKTKDAETKLAELATKAEEAERYAGFVEAATAAGIRNAKAAYLVAKHGSYFSAKGELETDRFKKDNPEFFTPVANANAGAGAGATTTAGGMNAAIRAAAGFG